MSLAAIVVETIRRGPQVLSSRYLWEIDPILESNQWPTDEECHIFAHSDEHGYHFVPKPLRDLMSPRTRTSYETLKAAASTPVAIAYSFGRLAKSREIPLTMTESDETFINDTLYSGHGAKAACELLFFKYSPLIALRNKVMGTGLGISLMPFAFMKGYTSPTS